MSSHPPLRARPARRAPAGFTLIELVITLAIASILLGVAVPSFVTVVKDAKLGELVDPPRRALLIARSEATRSNADVTVCPRASDEDCGTNWNNGLLVFVDNVIVRNEVTAVRDGADPILMIVPPHESRNTLRVFASNNRTSNGQYTPNFVRYGPDGRTDWQNGSLIACDARGTEHSRVLNVTLTGNVEEGRAGGTSGVARDVFGRDIDCT